MPFGHVPVARVGAVLSEWRRVSLTGRYTYTCSFYSTVKRTSSSKAHRAASARPPHTFVGQRIVETSLVMLNDSERWRFALRSKRASAKFRVLGFRV